jgi:hypothetical protein
MLGSGGRERAGRAATFEDKGQRVVQRAQQALRGPIFSASYQT